MAATSTRTPRSKAADARPGPGQLILLRHGRTSWNASGRFQGHADTELDDSGLAQAERAATQLRALQPDAVLSSDLRRAAQTAQLVSRRCGCGITFDAGLREQAVGAWEGLTPADAARRFPEEYAARAAGRDVRRGGGETEEEAGRRAFQTLLPALRHCDSGLTLVVVSHGLVIRGLLAGLAGTGRFDQPIPVVHLANGEWISLRSRASHMVAP